MVLKKTIKKRKNRRGRNRRKSQKAAGYSFKLDHSIPGGRPEVVTYNNCGSSLKEATAQTQETSEVVGLSNDNLALIQQQSVQQVPEDVVKQEEITQEEQTGGKRRRRRRRRKSRKSRRSLKRRTNNKRRRRRRSRKQKGGDYDCPSANMSLKEFGCKQPLWDSKCL